MKPLPTDLAILNAVYERYYDEFAAYSKDSPSRETKIYVPLDLAAIARDLGVDGDIVFGRFYYDLNNAYSYRRSDGGEVNLFHLEFGEERHCVHFPYAASILARLSDEDRRFRATLTVARLAIAVAIVAALISLASTWVTWNSAGDSHPRSDFNRSDSSLQDRMSSLRSGKSGARLCGHVF